MTLKIYKNIKFDGIYPVGSAAIVVAGSKEEAAMMLQFKLKDIGLEQCVNPNDMYEIPISKHVDILVDGDY